MNRSRKRKRPRRPNKKCEIYRQGRRKRKKKISRTSKTVLNGENIPDELKQLNNWVIWKYEKRDGDWTKVPYNPTNERLASSTDPDTWTDFETALNTAESGDFDGIGFVFTDTKYGGVDFDECRNPDTGELSDRAAEIVERIDTYTEISPSGEGLHIIVEGEIPEGGNKTGDVEGMKEIEFYHTGRYFTMSGNHLEGTSKYITDGRGELEKIHREIFKTEDHKDARTLEVDPSSNGEVNLEDCEILEKAKNYKHGEKFKRLWNGDRSLWEGETTKYTSHSEARQALCNILAFFTGPDPERILRLVKSSDLYRGPDDERKLKNHDIPKALKGRNEYYSPNESQFKNKFKTDDDRTAHQKLLEIADRVELFRTPDGRMFGAVTDGGTPRTYEIKKRGGRFRHWLVSTYERRHGEGPHSAAISRTLNVVRARTHRPETPERKIHKRVCDTGDKIYLDLAGDDRDAVRITGDGWSVVNDPEVNFWRPDGAGELPEPNGDLEGLRHLDGLLNMDPENFVLFVSWLTYVLQNQGPYPILNPNGPAGTGKSTLTKLIRLLLDPAGESGKAVMQTIGDSDDLFSVAKHRHIVALDNISTLKQWQSDALSAIATGGGIEKRKLYTDFDLATIDTMNPIVMNGIDITGIGDDLLDRMIFLKLEKPESRKPEQEFWHEFKDVRAEILGGICTLVSGALSIRDDVELTQEEMTRMADFSNWLKALRPTLKRIKELAEVDPLELYHTNREKAGRSALEESTFGDVLIEYLEDWKPNQQGLYWEGTAAELREELIDFAGSAITDAKDFPGSASWLSRRLKKMKTTLEKVGITHIKDTSGDMRVHRFIETDDN